MTDVPKSQPIKKFHQDAQPPLTTNAQRRAAIEAAFDYRGDITVETDDGRTFTGYIFDRRADASPPVFRLMGPDAPGERIELRYDQITRLHFSGRDTAAGKSWETWIKKYTERKQAGKTASI